MDKIGFIKSNYFGKGEWEAYSLGKAEHRNDVTALPFGISSTQVFAWIFLIIVPIYHQTGDALKAWQIAIAACCLGGLIEIVGGFVSKYLVRYIPNSALMGNMQSDRNSSDKSELLRIQPIKSLCDGLDADDHHVSVRSVQ